MMPPSRWATFLAVVLAPTIYVMKWWTSTCKFTSLHFFQINKDFEPAKCWGEIQMARIPIFLDFAPLVQMERMYGSKLPSYCFPMFNHNLPNYHTPFDYRALRNTREMVYKIKEKVACSLLKLEHF